MRARVYENIGIDSVEVDLPMEKVTVIGYVDRNKVLKAVRRAGKRAEFWPYHPCTSLLPTTISKTSQMNTKRATTIGGTATIWGTSMVTFTRLTAETTKSAICSTTIMSTRAASCN